MAWGRRSAQEEVVEWMKGSVARLFRQQQPFEELHSLGVCYLALSSSLRKSWVQQKVVEVVVSSSPKSTW